MHMVPIDRSNMNHHLVTSRDLTDQLAHEDQRPLPTLDIDISLPTRYDTYSPRSYGCQISPSASHRMLRIPSPKGEGFTDPQNATLKDIFSNLGRLRTQSHTSNLPSPSPGLRLLPIRAKVNFTER